VTGYGLDNWDSVVARGSDFFPSPPRPDNLCGPIGDLSLVY
jgi:hypothetical protein